MIDPTEVTNYNRSIAELEEYLLFCVSVAGKTASQISIALENFLNYDNICKSKELTPFEHIRFLDKISPNLLEKAIRFSKLGQHKKLLIAFRQLANSGLDLKACSIDDLEKIHGIGPKTARYFLLHTRPGQRIACLDTHVLRYMSKELGIKTPKASPSGQNYKKLEKMFIDHADLLGKDIAELDLDIWNRYSVRSGKQIA